jgi:hypothetical protein
MTVVARARVVARGVVLLRDLVRREEVRGAATVQRLPRVAATADIVVGWVVFREREGESERRHSSLSFCTAKARLPKLQRRSNLLTNLE